VLVFTIAILLVISLLSIQGCTRKKPVQLEMVSRTELGTGFASSAVNVSIFRQAGMITDGPTEWVAFYDADGYPAITRLSYNSPPERIARIQPSPGLPTLGDGHCVISIGSSDDGYLHVIYGAHGVQPYYARIALPISSNSVFTATLWSDKLTYPQFYRTDGLFHLVFRDDTSHRISSRIYQSGTWGPISSQWSLDPGTFQSVYIQRLAVVGSEIALTWMYRLPPTPDDIVRNQGLFTLRSLDAGATWRDLSGQVYQLPLEQGLVPELTVVGPNSGLMNQCCSTWGPDHRLYITSLHQDDAGIEQVHLLTVDFESSSLQKEAITQNTEAFEIKGGGTLVLPLSRPEVVVSKHQVYVIYRDTDRMVIASRGILPNSVHSWSYQSFSDGVPLGAWEPILDHDAWEKHHRLRIYVQSARQGPRDTESPGPPETAELLEFRERLR